LMQICHSPAGHLNSVRIPPAKTIAYPSYRSHSSKTQKHTTAGIRQWSPT
jgi:hypothetical protein